MKRHRLAQLSRLCGAGRFEQHSVLVNRAYEFLKGSQFTRLLERWSR
jgi:hypothetical protein